MKNFGLFFILLISCMIWCACPGDDDPCETTTCQNGGTPVEQNGGCECDCSGTGYTGTNCETKVLEPGVEHEGGIIFYVDNSGEHGLIAAQTDQTATAPWGCAGTSIANASNSSIGSGQGNTTAIVNACTIAGIAAKIAYDHSGNGQNDWYLPSEAELVQLYSQKNVVGGFEANWYWSSTQADATFAKQVNFADGTSGNEGKGNSYRVRAIRSF